MQRSKSALIMGRVPAVLEMTQGVISGSNGRSASPGAARRRTYAIGRICRSIVIAVR